MSTQGTITLSGLPIAGDTVSATDGQAAAISQIADEFNKNVGTSKIEDGAVTNTKLSTTAITLGFVEPDVFVQSITASSADVAGVTVTVTVPTGGRRIEFIYSFALQDNSTTSGVYNVGLFEDNTVIDTGAYNVGVTGIRFHFTKVFSKVATAGSHTYKLKCDGTTTGLIGKQSNESTSILVKAI